MTAAVLALLLALDCAWKAAVAIFAAYGFFVFLCERWDSRRERERLAAQSESDGA